MSRIPKVSVVIPTRNRPHLVGRAIRSALNQTFQEVEIIVIDDGDTKLAHRAVGAFSDERITYLRNEERLGGGGARNRGIEAAKGEIVAFLDDDDEWHEAKLARHVEAFNMHGENLSLVQNAVRAVNDGGEVLYGRAPKEEGVWRPMVETITKCFIWTSALSVRRRHLVAIGGFDASLKKNQEWDLQIRLLEMPSDFFSIKEPLTTIHISENEEQMGGRGNLADIVDGYEHFLKKHKTLYQKHPHAYALRLFHMSTLYRDWGKHWSATWYRLRASFYEPLNFVYASHLLVSLLGGSLYNAIRRKQNDE